MPHVSISTHSDSFIYPLDLPSPHLLALLHIDAQRLLYQHMMTARVTQHVQQDADMCHVRSGHDDDITHARVQQSLVVTKHLEGGRGGLDFVEEGASRSQMRTKDPYRQE